MKAIRTVSEDDDFHVIEGLLYPFSGPFPNGKDSYGTNFSARTNFYWDLFPDRSPSDPEDVPARFVRPVTYQHGFDPEAGLSRMGGYSPIRVDKRGVWVQAQLDKHHAYYEELRALLGEDALGFSGESSEHAVRIAKDGEVREWPAGPASLTPTPSNPFAAIAARSAEIRDVLVRVTGIRATDKSGKAVGPPEGGEEREDIPAEDFAGKNKSYPIVTPKSVAKAAQGIGRAGSDNYSTDELKANIIKIAKRKGSAFVDALPEAWKKELGLEGSRSALRTASDDVGWATHIQGDLAYLMGCEAGEADQLAKLQSAFDAITDFIGMESKEIGTDDDEPVSAAEPPIWPPSYMSALRQGRRNSGSDLALIDGIHDATVALGTTAHSDGQANDDRSPDADAERRAKGLPVRVTGMERTGAKKAVRKALRRAIRQASRTGSQIGESEVRRLVGRMS